MDLLSTELRSSDGFPLEFARCKHLFIWPGKLVAREGDLVVGDRGGIESEGLEEAWGYHPEANYGRVQPRCNHNPVAVPPPIKELMEMRRGIGRERFRPHESPYRPGYARPTAAAAFDAERSRGLEIGRDRAIENPLVQELGLQLQWPEPKPDPHGILQGATFALNALYGSEVFGVREVEILGIAVALGGVEVRRDERFRDRMKQAVVALRKKAARCEKEAAKFFALGRLPVTDPGGGVREELTVANLVTLYVAVWQLASLRDLVLGQIEGMRRVLQGDSG